MEIVSRQLTPTLEPPVPPASPAEWEAALEAYYGELCDYVLRLVGSAQTAEDLVHDLFLHLWRTRQLGNAERLSRPYLFAAARNRALKHLRHRRVAQAWVERASREEPAHADSPAEILARNELEVALGKAIEALPPRCREIFLLRRREGLSYDEIAKRAGVSLGTVKSQMWRAAVQLRESLAPLLGAAVALLAGSSGGPGILY